MNATVIQAHGIPFNCKAHVAPWHNFAASLSLAGLVLLCAASRAQAQTYVGNSLSDDWADSSAWSTLSVPVAGGDVTIGPSNSLGYFTLDTDYDSNNALDSITISSPANSPLSVTQASDINIDSFLSVGDQSGSSVDYVIDPGSNLTLTNTGTFLPASASYVAGLPEGVLYVGNDGYGEIDQTLNSTVTAPSLVVAAQAGSTGDYTLQGASLQSEVEYIGNQGTGSFTQNNAATNTISGLLDLGADATGTGVYTLGGDGPGDSLSASYEYVGYYGTGSFTQYSGTNTPTYELIVGNYSGSSGVYQQYGGTVTGQGYSIANSQGSTGTYQLGGNYAETDATLTAYYQYVGYGGSGAFTEVGSYGAATTNNAGLLLVGGGPNGVGTYSLANYGYDAYTVNLNASSEVIGDQGTGTFNQYGGVNTITAIAGAGSTIMDYNYNSSTPDNFATGALYIGNQAGSSGYYGLYDGTLIAAAEYVGVNSNSADFDQQNLAEYYSVSEPDINNVGLLDVGYGTSGWGSYILSGDDADVTQLNASTEIIGDAGRGSFFQGGGYNTVTGTLTLGSQSGSRGAYFLSQGVDSITFAPQNISDLSAGKEIIGDAGMGEFYQEFGENTVGSVSNSGDLVLANQAGSIGLYNLSGGTLTVTGTEYIGVNGSGTFTQTGGSNTTANLKVAAGSSYSISSSAGAATLTVNGTTTNSGTITVTNMTSGVNMGNYVSIGGHYIPDPSSINFTSISLDANSVVQGETGDVFKITGNFTDDSTNASNNLAPVTLDFQGGGTHTINWDGTGTIGEIELASGDDLTLNLATNLDVETLDIISSDQLTITGGGALVYDAGNPANSYLDDEKYTPNNGGVLEPSNDVVATPEPSTWALLLGGVGLLVYWQRRRAAGVAIRHQISKLNPS